MNINNLIKLRCPRNNLCKILSRGYLSMITALGSHLVDLGLRDVSALLSFLQLMLDLPEPGQVSVGLLLLLRVWSWSMLYFFKYDIILVWFLSVVTDLCYIPIWKITKYLTHSLLSLSLVSLDFELQLIHQILKSVHILLVLLSL